MSQAAQSRPPLIWPDRQPYKLLPNNRLGISCPLRPPAEALSPRKTGRLPECKIQSFAAFASPGPLNRSCGAKGGRAGEQGSKARPHSVRKATLVCPKNNLRGASAENSDRPILPPPRRSGALARRDGDWRELEDDLHRDEVECAYRTTSRSRTMRHSPSSFRHSCMPRQRSGGSIGVPVSNVPRADI